MAARHKNGPSANHNRRSDNTTSGTSGSTESEMHGSYDWRENNAQLPEVDMTALLSMRHSEESNANELQQRIRYLDAVYTLSVPFWSPVPLWYHFLIIQYCSRKWKEEPRITKKKQCAPPPPPKNVGRQTHWYNDRENSFPNLYPNST